MPLQPVEQTVSPATSVVIDVSPVRVIRVLLAAAAFLVAAGMAVQVSAFVFHHDTLLGLVHQFNLDEENNTPSWFSTVLILSCSATLGANAKAEWDRRGPHAKTWFALAGLFLLLSLDEAASWHETFDRCLKRFWSPGGYLERPWVVPGAVAAGLLALALARFLLHLPPATRRRFLSAGLIYVTGCIGMEMAGGKYLAHFGRLDLTYYTTVACEEGLEMLGMILFLRALLAYLADYSGGFTVRVRG